MRWIARKIAWSRIVRLVPDGLTYLGLRSRLKPPSFEASISRSVRLRKIAVAQGLDFPVWKYDDKLAGRRLAEELGLRVPELYAVGTLEECVAEAQRRGSAVIKPVNRHSTQGVVVLTLQGDRFFDHLRNRSEPIEHLERYVRRQQFEREDVLLVEELVFRPGSRETPSYDWKFFCFAGETGLIFQTDRFQGARVDSCRWRRADYSTVSAPQFHGYRKMRSMSDPKNPEALREAAERYSVGSQTAFARIDLYEDDRGPVFGEITPHPSAGMRYGNFYGRDLDRQMGRMWEEAEIRMATGSLDRLDDRR